MPRTESGAGLGQDLQRSGANPTIFYLFLDLVWGRSGTSFKWSGAGMEHVPVMILCKIFKNREKWTCIDIRQVVVKLSGSSATPYSMASLLKNFQFNKPNLPLTFQVQQTFSISDRPFNALEV